jgi:hypothetical protein
MIMVAWRDEAAQGMISETVLIKTMERLDSMYMAAIRAHLECQTRFSKGQVAGVGLAYIALNLLPVDIIEVDVDEIFRED